ANAEGVRAYRALMSNPPDLNAVTKLPGYRVHRGPTVPAYWIYGDKKWWDDVANCSASGVFIAGDTYHRDGRTSYVAPNEWFSLDSMLNAGGVGPGDTIYWLACRSWCLPDNSVLPAPSADPKPPAWFRALPRKVPGVPTRVLA